VGNTPKFLAILLIKCPPPRPTNQRNLTKVEMNSKMIDEVSGVVQGRSRLSTRTNRRELGRRYSKLPEGVVWEFGNQVDLENEVQVGNYLHKLDEWFREQRKPKSLGSCRAKVNTFVEKGPHRSIGLIVLAQNGNAMAKLFLAVKRGILDEEQYKAYELGEVQGFGATEGVAVAGLFVGMAAAYFARSRIDRAGECAAKFLGKAGSASDEIAGLASRLSGVMDNVTGVCSVVVEWIKASYQKLKSFFTGKVMMGVMTFVSWILKFVVVVMALTLVRTVAKVFFVQVMEYLRGIFRLPVRMNEWWADVKVQSGGSFLPEMLETLYEYVFGSVAGKAGSLLVLLGTLPKITSIAKAIEWILEKFGKIVSWMIESYTGELQGTTALECAVLDFKSDVLSFKYDIEKATAEELATVVYAQRLSALEFRNRELMLSVMRKDKLRGPIHGAYIRAQEELEKTAIDYKSKLMAGGKRATPVVVYISGEPGVGKTRWVEEFLNAVWATAWDRKDKRGQKLFDLQDFDMTQCYNYSQKDQFRDGYRQQKAMLIDDFFQETDPELRMHTAGDIIGMCSSAPYALLVADMNRKSACFFTTRLIIITSNLGYDLRGDKAGLEDVRALIGRFTIPVEQLEVEEGKDPMYAIDGAELNGYKGVNTKNHGDTRAVLTFEQLVSITVDALFERDKEARQPPKRRVVPEYKCTFKSERFKMGEDEVDDEVDDGKGKDKEKGGDEGGLQSSDKQFMKLHHYEQEDADEYDWKMWLKEEENIQEIEEKKDYYRDVVDIGIQCELGWNQWTTLQEMRNAWRMEKMREREGVPQSGKQAWYEAVSRWEEREDCGDEARKRYKNAAKRRAKGKEKIRREQLSWFAWAAGSLKEREIRAFNALPDWIRRKMYKYFPAALLPSLRPNDKYRDAEDLTFEEWKELPDMAYFAEWHGPPTMDDYVEVSEAYSGPFTPLVLGAVAALGLVAAVVVKAVQIMMPSAAYDDMDLQSLGFDTKAPGAKKPGKKERRAAKRAGRGNVGVRSKAATELFSSGMVQAGQHPAITLYEQNAEIIEVYGVPKGRQFAEERAKIVPQHSWALFLGGRRLLCPRHTVFGYIDAEKYDIWMELPFVKHAFCVSKSPYIKHLTGDLMVIEVPGISERRNIIGHFADSLPGYGTIWRVEPKMNHTGSNAIQGLGWENAKRHFDVNSAYGQVETDLLIHKMPNQAGDCGQVYVHLPSGKIVAVHQAGSTSSDTSFAVLVTREMLEPCLADVQCCWKDIDVRTDFELEEAPRLAGVKVLGYVKSKFGTFMPGDTKLRRTPFDMSTFPLGDTEDVPRMLKPTKVQGELVSPIGNLFRNKIAKLERTYDVEPLACLDGFLPKSFNRRNVFVCTIEQAIFGIPGVLKPMDRHTSVGYYYKKLGLTREDLFGPVPEDGVYKIHKVLRADVERIVARLEQGILVPAVFELFLKDELGTVEKYETGNTRPVDPCDLAMLIVQRMYLGTFIEEAMKDPVYSPVALGINPHSGQWGALWARHFGDGTRAVGAGDFKMFDMTINNVIRDDFIRMLMMNHPVPLMAGRVTMCNFVGLHILFTLLFLRLWGTCSGSLITALFNCFANWWIHKKAFLSVYDEEEFARVFLTFVGDDSIFSVDSGLPLYTMELISVYCRNINMEYTSPWKDQTLFVGWDNLIFLKRRFVPTERGVMAPLAAPSLTNMVKWSEAPSDDEVTQSTMQSLLLEMWHYGEDKYREVEKWCRTEIAKHGMRVYLPDWKEMEFTRRGDYQFGLATVRGEGKTRIMRAVVAFNRFALGQLGYRATWTVIPWVEEILRTIVPGFTQELVCVESEMLETVLASVPECLHPAGRGMRAAANHFHWIMGATTRLAGWLSLVSRVRAHQQWNWLVYQNQLKGRLVPPDWSDPVLRAAAYW